MTKELQAMAYAINAHEETNHRYNGMPYAAHLFMVVQYAYKYKKLLPDGIFEDIAAPACWLHDTIEDCRKTYNDIKVAMGEDVANVVYALTNDKGKNRAERGNKRYYDGIVYTPWALFVKLCDRLANVYYSKATNSSMMDAYRKEHNKFVVYVSAHQSIRVYQVMITELQSLLTTQTTQP